MSSLGNVGSVIADVTVTWDEGHVTVTATDISVGLFALTTIDGFPLLTIAGIPILLI